MFEHIVEALEGIEWTTIDSVRIGYRYHIWERPEQRPPAGLWVGVKPGTTSWERGFARTKACKSILLSYGISDVECELRESVVLIGAYTWEEPKKFKKGEMKRQPRRSMRYGEY